ncbi:G patch domain and ankyrin repeat-containing protein 1 isoform X2 [Struthio camelus]|uniref:G patch domain and ankyrin repeat-containing protein 1 isoform X2 n=1 Tax=Struthio camelus TaxID=8801 RepID=UPI003603AE1E
MAQLIAFTRARDETDCWKDGHLQRRPAAPAEPGSQAGDEARRFYESLLAGEDGAGPAAPPVPPAAPPATPSEPPVPPAEPPPAPSEPPRARRKPPAAPSGPTDTRRGNALLKAAQDGDLGTLRRLLEKEGCDVNYRDGFAWTALMPAPAERRFCGVCGTHYAEESAAQHERSTAHLLSRGDPPPPARYHIPETNVGFRLLVKGGWDGRAGLGPAGDGRRFPVQTLLKRDHRGLGCPSDLRPRVTHFEARDAAAVAEPPKPRAERAGAAGKRQAQRREAAARAWERDLRAYMGR